MHFLQPTWLWAIGAMAVPIIIHLWNIKEGKTLKVGSILFLQESARSHAKSLKLTDLLLLILRCLLLIWLALLLSKPFYVNEFDVKREKGWILVEKNTITKTYNHFKSRIDSLVAAGYSFHYFQTGFSEEELETALKATPDSINKTDVSYWTLLEQLDQQLPADLPVFLFTGNQLQQFGGSRPTVDLNLDWSTYDIGDTAGTAIAKARRTLNDSIRLTIANYKPTGTFYSYQNISPQFAGPRFKVVKNGGKSFVSFSDTTGVNEVTAIDTSTMLITIYTDKFSDDANYLAAAISAIRDFTKLPIQLTVAKNLKQLPEQSDWLFWLSEAALPTGVKSDNVLVYEKGKVENVRSVITPANQNNNTPTTEVALFKSVKSAKSYTSPIWTDGYGNAVLSVEQSASNVYHFYSRFNPQWNDLTWSNEFPQMLLGLIDKPEATVLENDLRTVDAKQLLPVKSTGKRLYAKEDLVSRTDLSKIFWLIAFAIFLIERLIAFKAKKEQAYA